MQFTNQRSFIESIQAGSLTKEWNAAKNRVIESDSRGKQAIQAMGEVSGLIGKTLKTIAAPLFDHVIPNIKSGINAQQLMAWMEANKGANDTEIVKAAQRITDNTDNTLGEMRYDNLFWNKTMTQIMQTFVLAPSYTAGTIRAVGGGAISAFQNPERISFGSKDFDPRAAYVVALPLAVMLTNAVYQYLKTGTGPQDLQDLLMGPKTGGKTPNGDPERAALAGYWRQITGTFIDSRAKPIIKWGHSQKGLSRASTIKTTGIRSSQTRGMELSSGYLITPCSWQKAPLLLSPNNLAGGDSGGPTFLLVKF